MQDVGGLVNAPTMPSVNPIRPAPILLMSSGALLTSIVWPVDFQSVGLLNLHGAMAAQTFHAKQVPWDFR